MPTVHFTPNLRRHIDCPTQTVSGKTLRDVLEEVFALNPSLRGYVLDDQQRLRQHMTVFIDQQPLTDRLRLSDVVQPSSEIYVMQALSGG